MELILVIIIGILYSAGLYMIMRRSFVKVIIGLIFLGHAANLLIFTVGRITKGAPSFIKARWNNSKKFCRSITSSINTNCNCNWFWCSSFCNCFI